MMQNRLKISDVLSTVYSRFSYKNGCGIFPTGQKLNSPESCDLKGKQTDKLLKAYWVSWKVRMSKTYTHWTLDLGQMIKELPLSTPGEFSLDGLWNSIMDDYKYTS